MDEMREMYTTDLASKVATGVFGAGDKKGAKTV